MFVMSIRLRVILFEQNVLLFFFYDQILLFYLTFEYFCLIKNNTVTSNKFCFLYIYYNDLNKNQ